MLIHLKNGLVIFSSFKKFSNLFCSLTTKHWDKLNFSTENKDRIEKLAKFLDIDKSTIYRMEQIHGSKVVEDWPDPNILPQCDGLISQKINSFITVQTADCVPIYFYESKKQKTGVVHAGWKGINKGIMDEFIKKWQIGNGFVRNTYVAIGPHIGGCCYTINKDRVDMFYEKGFSQAIYKNGNLWHLDLGQIIRNQLIKMGIPVENIDAPVCCTSCQNNLYHSYRKDGVNCGRMVGFLGVKS